MAAAACFDEIKARFQISHRADDNERDAKVLPFQVAPFEFCVVCSIGNYLTRGKSPPCASNIHKSLFPSHKRGVWAELFYVFDAAERGKYYNGLFGIDSELFMREPLTAFSFGSQFIGLCCALQFLREIWCL